MPELSRAPTASRSALLDLKDELGLVNDGYEFLDEKRILLAAEILRQRDAWAEHNLRFMRHFEAAAASLADAAADQGLDGLQVAPPAGLPDARLEFPERPYVGQHMLEAELTADGIDISEEPIRPTPQLRACRDAFVALLADAASLAASSTNLSRLMYEYRRTERRVRALENIVLPEIHADIASMEEQLDLLEQEEVIRVRTLRSTGD